MLRLLILYINVLSHVRIYNALIHKKLLCKRAKQAENYL